MCEEGGGEPHGVPREWGAVRAGRAWPGTPEPGRIGSRAAVGPVPGAVPPSWAIGTKPPGLGLRCLLSDVGLEQDPPQRAGGCGRGPGKAPGAVSAQMAA